MLGGSVRTACRVLQGLVIASFLPAEVYGAYTVIFSVIAVVFGIVDFRVADTVIRFTDEMRQREGRLAAQWLGLCFLLAEAAKGIAAIILVGGASYFLGRYVYRGIPGFALFAVAFSLHNFFLTFNPTLSAFLRIAGRFSWLSAYDIVFGIGSVCGIAFTLARSPNLVPLAVAFATIGLCGAVFKIAICWGCFRNSFKLASLAQLREFPKPNVPWRELISFTVDLSAASTLRFLYRNLDVLILGALCPASTVGVYGLARKIRLLPAMLLDTTTTVLYPEFSKKCASGNKEQVFTLLFKVTKVSLAASTVLFFLIAVTARFAVPQLFDSTYEEAVKLIWWFGPEVIISTGLISWASAAMATGNSRLLVITAALRLITLIAVVPLVMLAPNEPQAMALALGFAVVASNLLLVRRLSGASPRACSTVTPS